MTPRWKPIEAGSLYDYHYVMTVENCDVWRIWVRKENSAFTVRKDSGLHRGYRVVFGPWTRDSGNAFKGDTLFFAANGWLNDDGVVYDNHKFDMDVVRDAINAYDALMEGAA